MRHSDAATLSDPEVPGSSNEDYLVIWVDCISPFDITERYFYNKAGQSIQVTVDSGLGNLNLRIPQYVIDGCRVVNVDPRRVRSALARRAVLKDMRKLHHRSLL